MPSKRKTANNDTTAKTWGTVNICGIDYTVEQRDIDDDPNLSDCYGYVNHANAIIVLRTKMTTPLFLNTLFHEIQHGIWEHSGLKELSSQTPDFQETFIQIFTPHWIAAKRSMKEWG